MSDTRTSDEAEGQAVDVVTANSSVNSARDPRDGGATLARSGSDVAGWSFPSWILLLAANWPILLGGVVLALVITAIPQLAAPRQYVAESLIAPTVSWTQVQFEPKIKTVDSSAQNPTTGGLTPERRQALVDLIRSSSIEQQVLTTLAGKVTDTDLQPGALAQHISGGLKPRSEILGIQAVAPSPDTAVALSAAWARAYVDHVNQVYAPADSDTSITQLRDQAQAQLQQAQDALTASLRDSRLEALDRKISSDEDLLKLSQSPYGQPGSSAQSASASQASGSVLPAPAGQGASSPTQLNDYRLAERRTLDDVAQTLRRLDATRESVRALITQASSDSTGVASAAAFALVKAQLVSISDGLPAQVQFQLPVGESGVTPAQLQALVNSIEQARAEVTNEFEQRRQTYEAHRDQQVTALESELRDLRAQREAADSERKQLTARRDLASDTYSALSRKAEEAKVTQGSQGHEVELASQATFAVAAPRFSTTMLALAALIGFALAAALVLVASVVSIASPSRRVWRLQRNSVPARRARANEERRVGPVTP